MLSDSISARAEKDTDYPLTAAMKQQVCELRAMTKMTMNVL